MSGVRYYIMVATMAGKAGKAGMAGKAGKAGNSYIFNPFALSGWNLVLFSVHSRFPQVLFTTLYRGMSFGILSNYYHQSPLK